ncbi:hypothetical protein ACFC5T_40240 [Streptomyces sp. NPDC055961]|uniref:hypothetical protein n=1 Tax=Streptomyces sp. NPDC055961 TaxID=3345666 RepID=UPI0035DDF9D3
MSFYDSTGTPVALGIFPGLPIGWPLKPGTFPGLPPERLPTVIIIVLFTMAVAAGKYDLAAALGTLAGAPFAARERAV